MAYNAHFRVKNANIAIRWGMWPEQKEIRGRAAMQKRGKSLEVTFLHEARAS